MSAEAERVVEDAKTVVERLRAEQGAQAERGLSALLLHECGALEEVTGEEPAAARDFLAAFNLDPQFREPLEALVRILTRRKSVKNLGKLLEALTRAASSPEERSRALVSRAAFLQDFEPDLAAARDCLEEAVSEAPEDPLLWLELELVYAKTGDMEGRQRALEARAELALDPTWKALLYIDLAGLAADAGDASRAYELLDAASALDGRGRYAARKALAAIATRFESAADLARALESQGDLVADAIESSEQGDATGVPRSERTAAHAADAWLRAASVRARVDGPAEALALVERAAALLPGSAALARMRLAALESAGDTPRAVALARELATSSPPSKGSAALWLRVAVASRAAHDVGAAEGELARALEADPTSLPARALRMELLGDGRDAKALALALEAAALGYSSEEARGRGLFLAAFVWASQAGDATAAKDALSRGAGLFGTPGDGARVARTLAAIAGDGAWYEESTVALLTHGAREEERAALWLELARARLLRGDEAGGAEALLALAGEPGGAWLGRTLSAYAVGLTETSAGPLDPAALDALASAESDPDLAGAFSMGAALRRARSGDAVKAQQKLRALHDADAGDEATALLLAELERRGGDVLAAAGTLAACAAATDDVELGAALHLEAGILLFRAGQRGRAIEEMEAAQAGAPKAAATVLSWALRGAEPDTKQGRLRALEIATEAGADPIVGALERFGLEVALGGPDAEPADATTALETLEARSWGDLAVAGALGRLTLPVAAEDRAALDTALDRLDALGGAAAQIAWAERFRTARTLDQDRAASVTAAARWADVDGGAHVAAEWLAASFAAEDREAEIAARRRLAEAVDGDLAPALFSAAAAVSSLDHAGPHEPLVKRDGPASRLLNLELAPPGCDPRRRSVALRALDSEDLGTEAYIDALSLAAWSDLAAGASEQARDAFRSIVEARPDDIASWEGLRAASESLGEVVAEAMACAEIGALSISDERGAEHWERAGTLLEKTEAKDRAMVAFERAFERDPRRGLAFDRLFRHVRATGQNDALLAVVARRLDVAEDETELAKLYWERARALRNKGDADAALAALEDVTMLEPEHVGALALAGEIQIKKGEFTKAAPLLAQLASIAGAPPQQRLMSGVMAADLYEKRLAAPKDALRVLVELHRGGLATMAVRERLAALAAKNGDWSEATRCLEELMSDRDTKPGRIEAARLAMVIWRDKVGEPARALNAVTKLLDESPDDPEAVELLLSNDVDAGLRKRLVDRAKTTLLGSLARDPTDAARVALLAKIASHGNDAALRQATLGALVALGRDEAAVLDELVRLDGRVAARPEIRLDASTLAEISDPEDRGPLAELFEQMASTIALALGPSLVSIGVTKRERIDARGGHPLRLAVASWLGALGIDGDFELYVGGREPKGVYGIPGDEPTIVLGPGVTTPLDAMTRSALAREVFALRRGISSVRSRDDATIASIVVAACQEVKVPVQQPPFAVFAEVSRGIHKEIPRRVRNSIGEICQRIVSSGADSKAWAAAARRSIDRMAVIGAGDASLVIADLLGVERARLGGAAAESERARRLLTFVLSPQYLEIRRKLGMGVR